MKQYLPYIAVAVICIIATFSITRECTRQPSDHKPIIEELNKAKVEILDSVSNINKEEKTILLDQDETTKAHEKIQSRPIIDPVLDSLTWTILDNFPAIKRRRPKISNGPGS